MTDTTEAEEDSTDQKLEDKYTVGIWRDVNTGEFCQIRSGDNSNVKLYSHEVDPESVSEYCEMSMEKWDEVSSLMYPVSEQAIKNPIKTLLDIESKRGSIQNMSESSFADYEWCEQHTERDTVDGYDPNDYV